MGEVGEVSKSNVQSLQKNVGVMLNNKEFSDTVFLVNTSQFYASSHLVSVSSKPFKSLLTDHFNNCADKIIKISNVKHDDSFHIILKCIYGIEINFTQTDKAVLCEVLCLCDTYELTHFSKNIQCYLSKLESFQIDSVVVLLNTAKKFNLMDLYKRLSIFAYQNTDQLVKHISFVNLQFDVLVDLIQSDWFCTLEIDILTGVLNWHNDMAKSGRRNYQETYEKKNESAQAIEQHNAEVAGVSKGSIFSSDATDLAVYDDTADMFHSEEVYPRNESSRMVEKHAEFSGNNSSGKTLDNALETKEADKSTELVRTFSENVLKSLMSHIRAPRISYLDFMKASETELFATYKEILSDYTLFSHDGETRTKYVAQSGGPSNVLADHTTGETLPSLTSFPAAAAATTSAVATTCFAPISLSSVSLFSNTISAPTVASSFQLFTPPVASSTIFSATAASTSLTSTSLSSTPPVPSIAPTTTSSSIFSTVPVLSPWSLLTTSAAAATTLSSACIVSTAPTTTSSLMFSTVPVPSSQSSLATSAAATTLSSVCIVSTAPTTTSSLMFSTVPVPSSQSLLATSSATATLNFSSSLFSSSTTVTNPTSSSLFSVPPVRCSSVSGTPAPSLPSTFKFTNSPRPARKIFVAKSKRSI